MDDDEASAAGDMDGKSQDAHTRLHDSDRVGKKNQNNLHSIRPRSSRFLFTSW